MNEHKPLQDNFKKKQRKAVLRLVALLLVTATLISTAAWSWFTDPDAPATANGLRISIEAPEEDFEISLDGGAHWHKSIDLLADSELLSGLNMVPVTGLGYTTSNGKVFLQIPEFSYDDDGRVDVVSSGNWAWANANVDYISLEVMFRTKKPSNIYIGAGTTVTTECENNGKQLDKEPIDNISLYGDFSRDAIVGALRMSVAVPNIGEGSTDPETLKLLWIPRPDVTLCDNNDGSYELQVDYNISEEDAKIGAHKYYLKKTNSPERTIETYTDRCVKSDKIFTAVKGNCNQADDRTMISTTVKPKIDESQTDGAQTDESEDYAYCTAYIRIWIDGLDSEAKRALVGGKFQLKIVFVSDGIPETAITTTVAEEDDVA